MYVYIYIEREREKEREREREKDFRCMFTVFWGCAQGFERVDKA